jgi:hypothetical protein
MRLAVACIRRFARDASMLMVSTGPGKTSGGPPAVKTRRFRRIRALDYFCATIPTAGVTDQMNAHPGY